ncbi:MAG: VOC family protein [candidate division Zixibacteria bacterium]|nr:VOC family protein [Candidatus Tariuqbacter arcticus]
MPTICHFEIPFDEVGRAQKFYTELFGWKIEKDPNMDYWVIDTGDPGKGVCGGMMKRQVPEQQILNYIDVPSVEESLAKVEELGGKTVMAKTPVPGMGWFGVCLDTENNAFGLWETDEKAK